LTREKDLNLCNKKGKTALFYAKDPKMLYLLLEYGADPTAGSSGELSLLEEFLRKNPENARALLSYEVPVQHVLVTYMHFTVQHCLIPLRYTAMGILTFSIHERLKL
jgi:ankyrin repeat protein